MSSENEDLALRPIKEAAFQNRGKGLGSIKLREFVLLLVFVLLLFESELQNSVNPAFAYIDEGASLLLFFWALGVSVRGHERYIFEKYDWIGILCLSAVCICGFFGNYLHDVQPSFSAILIDFFTCIKFFLAFWSSIVLLGCRNFDHILTYCVSFSKIATASLFTLMVINQFFDIGLSVDSRYGIKCFLFFSGHPSSFAASIVAMLVLLMHNPKKNKLYILMSIVLLCSSMRFKAIGFAVAVILELTLFPKRDKLTMGFVVTAIIVVFVAAYGQVATYYFNDETARSVLMRESFTVANAFFPLGAGFAGYGSFVTLDNYVPLYFSLGFDHVYGLTPLHPAYLADTFWPIVIGQFGYLGSAGFVLLVFVFLRGVLKRRECSESNFWAVLAVPTYLLITSTSEPSFFSAYAVSLSLVLAIILRSKEPLQNSKQNLQNS